MLHTLCGNKGHKVAFSPRELFAKHSPAHLHSLTSHSRATSAVSLMQLRLHPQGPQPIDSPGPRRGASWACTPAFYCSLPPSCSREVNWRVVGSCGRKITACTPSSFSFPLVLSTGGASFCRGDACFVQVLPKASQASSGVKDFSEREATLSKGMEIYQPLSDSVSHFSANSIIECGKVFSSLGPSKTL